MINYPNLAGARVIGVDIETKDPNLLDLGPGVYRKDGHVLGVSVATEAGAEYYNLGHEGVGAEEREKNLEYIREVLALPVPKIGANLLYDLDWLCNGLGLPLAGKLHDVQIAEPLLDEYRRSYSLDSLSRDYLGKTKASSAPAEYAKARGWGDNFRAHLYKMPYAVVREYAKADADLPIHIFKKQHARLAAEGLLDVYALEMRLYPVLLEMRRAGVRVDRKRIVAGISYLSDEVARAEAELFKQYGAFQVNSGKQLAEIFDRLGVSYPRHAPTELMKDQGRMAGCEVVGNPNLDKDSLKAVNHPLAAEVLRIREMKTALGNFFAGSFSRFVSPDDRIHCNFNPLRSEDYGTITGRLSSSKPNLQQIPSGKNLIGEMARSVFIPEEECTWGKLDWSQIEYRIIAHYATGAKSEQIREAYREKPETDYHAWVMSLTGLDRKTAKTLNFGMAYFMGIDSMCRKYGFTKAEATDLFELYHREVPFIKATRSAVVYNVKRDGFIRTVLGRRGRLTPEIRREGKEHSFFSRFISGSAADVMKASMVAAYEAGLFRVLVPHLTVHDELDVSIPNTEEGREAFRELKRVMETTIKFSVPLIAEAKTGPDWFHLEGAKA